MPGLGGFKIKKEIRSLMILILGTFFAISPITYLGYRYEAGILFPSLASSAIGLFTSTNLKSEVKSVAGGQLLSALVGVTVYQLAGTSWWSISVGVALAAIVMHIIGTLHPPGGATAFAAVYFKQSYKFVFVPVTLGVAILILSASFICLFSESRDFRFKGLSNDH